MENNVNPVAQQVVEQNVNESNTNGIPGSLPGETRAETQARLYKVMVDGQELDVDEEELKRGYAHARAAAKRMEEASMTRKEAEAVLKLMKQNPKEAMAKLGLNPRQFAEMVISEELEEALLDPKEKELRNAKRQLEQYQRAEKEARERFEREQMEAELQRQAEAIQTEIIDVLGASGLPKTERTVSRMVYYLQAALQAGYNVGPKDVVEQVKKDYQFDLKSMLGGLTEDQIEMFLDGEIVRKIAKSTVKSERKPQVVPKSVNANREERQDKKKIRSPKDFFDRGY